MIAFPSVPSDYKSDHRQQKSKRQNHNPVFMAIADIKKHQSPSSFGSLPTLPKT